VEATGDEPHERAVQRAKVVIVPRAIRRSASPQRLAVTDPLGIWGIESRLARLGHKIAAVGSASAVVGSEIDRSLLAGADGSTRLLLLARSSEAIPVGLDAARSAVIRPRRSGVGTAGQLSPWDGDWVSVFAWAAPGIMPGLPRGGLLGDPHAEVFPDHVVGGLEGDLSGATVGIFTGWLHHPAALLAEVGTGPGTGGEPFGRFVVTTLRLSPEEGPVATALLESLIQDVAGRRTDTSPVRRGVSSDGSATLASRPLRESANGTQAPRATSG
jgi:hypothetical protein